MERDRLVKLAPRYYEIAVCNFFAGTSHGSRQTLGGIGSIEFWAPLDAALRGLQEKKMLEAIPDDFGPTIFVRTDSFKDQWEEMKKDKTSPCYRYALDPQRDIWLKTALAAVNKAYKEEKIEDKDFLKPDAEWEPIPVDRADPKLQHVTRALEKTIEEVQQDNGYNATLPEEKAFVVDSLKAATEKLKRDDVVSFAYLKRKAIDVLDVIIHRFGTASVGLTAQAARAAIFDWLKSIGGQILHWLF